MFFIPPHPQGGARIENTFNISTCLCKKKVKLNAVVLQEILLPTQSEREVRLPCLSLSMSFDLSNWKIITSVVSQKSSIKNAFLKRHISPLSPYTFPVEYIKQK